MSLASRDNTPLRGVIPQTSSTTLGEYYYISFPRAGEGTR